MPEAAEQCSPESRHRSGERQPPESRSTAGTVDLVTDTLLDPGDGRWTDGGKAPTPPREMIYDHDTPGRILGASASTIPRQPSRSKRRIFRTNNRNTLLHQGHPHTTGMWAVSPSKVPASVTPTQQRTGSAFVSGSCRWSQIQRWGYEIAVPAAAIS